EFTMTAVTIRPADPPDSPAPERHALDALLDPRSVAVIGATDREGSVGRTVLWNLSSKTVGGQAWGSVYPINPKRKEVLGIRAFQKVGDIPEAPDLAVIVTPAPTVPAMVEECGLAGVRGIVVISAGFKEVGHEGELLEGQIMEQVRRFGMRLIGPNCLGLMRPHRGFNASFA